MMTPAVSLALVVVFVSIIFTTTVMFVDAQGRGRATSGRIGETTMIAGPYYGCRSCDSTCIGRENCSVWRESRMPDSIEPGRPPVVRGKS